MNIGGPGYFAFISYSHQDEQSAAWLHKALEGYRVPSRLVGQTTAAGVIPRRLLPIFRDRDELASATDLSRTVNAALARSMNLIVICSPHAATSRWVNEEVLAFKRLGRGERIFCLIVDGEPNASDLPGRAAEECFAPALRRALSADGELTTQRIEPVAADARAGKDGRNNAKLKLVAGMLDVGFDALKQRELQRRNRRMAAVTAAALLVMTITTALAITAAIARHDAERRQKQAEDLVGFMLGDLNEKLQQVHRLDIAEAVDDKAMAYFQSLSTTDVTEEVLEQRSKALEKIGSVRLDQGHIPQAMESFQAALQLAGRLAQAAPENVDRQIAYSRLWTYRGMAAWNQGDLDTAQQNFESAQSVLQSAETRAGKKAELVYQLTSIDNDIGHVLEARGRLDEAEVQYRKMLAHCNELVAGPSTKPEWRSQLGASHNNLGKLALMRGDLATAVAEYAADDAIESELTASDPKNNDQLTNTFTVRAILGRTLALTGDVGSGIRDLRQAVEIATRLGANDPTATDVQENLALYQVQLSRLLRLSGALPEANELTARSLATFDALTKQDPTNTAWLREFAEARTEHAEQLLAIRQVDDARGQLQIALDAIDPLFAKQPNNRALALATIRARLSMAEIAKDASAAEKFREEALTATRSVLSGGDDSRLLALQAEALLGLRRKADAHPVIQKLWDSGYGDLALVAILRREGIEYPVNSAFQERLQAVVKPKDPP